MGTPTNYYVDPSLGSDAGDGSVGTPWGRASGSVVQHALDTISPQGTDGDQINIKAGTDDILAASLSVANYGVPGKANPLVFRGYTATANDGGIGGIDGAGSYAVWAAGGYASFIDLHCHNSGAATVLTVLYATIAQCEIDTTTGDAVVASTNSIVTCCDIHGFGGSGINVGNNGKAIANYIHSHNVGATYAVYMSAAAGKATNNIISVSGSTNGIYAYYDYNVVLHNSILSAAGSGYGIYRYSTRVASDVLNNLVDGFSGSGGNGILMGTGGEYVTVYGHNAVYNCETNYNDGSADIIFNAGDNEELDATPFAKPDGVDNTFANRFTYFAPADVGNIQGGAYPSGCRLDKGAVQHADAGGGGLVGMAMLAGRQK